MRVLNDDEVVQIILEQGPITPEEFARMAYPVRAAYLVLMLSWAKERGLDHLIEQREALKPMVHRGLEEVAELISHFWKREIAVDEARDEPIQKLRRGRPADLKAVSKKGSSR